MNQSPAIWDLDIEIKVRIIILFFSSITSHCECILALFVVFLCYLIERLDQNEPVLTLSWGFCTGLVAIVVALHCDQGTMIPNFYIAHFLTGSYLAMTSIITKFLWLSGRAMR